MPIPRISAAWPRRDGAERESGQLACEVTVGLVLSLLRLLQVRLQWPIIASIGWLQGLLLLQAVVWGVNVLQIGVNRIRPLLS